MSYSRHEGNRVLGGSVQDKQREGREVQRIKKRQPDSDVGHRYGTGTQS